jgi:predicted alpha/beta-fold hydrolase
MSSFLSWIRKLFGGSGGQATRSTDDVSDERYGLFILKDQLETASAVVDIVALHGLNGHWNDTWTSPISGANWLKDEGFLPTQVPNARIMSYGYNSSVFGTTAEADINSFAEQLLNQLQGRRSSIEEKKRPIIFICHSLGGIVAKKVR